MPASPVAAAASRGHDHAPATGASMENGHLVAKVDGPPRTGSSSSRKGEHEDLPYGEVRDRGRERGGAAAGGESLDWEGSTADEKNAGSLSPPSSALFPSRLLEGKTVGAIGCVPHRGCTTFASTRIGLEHPTLVSSCSGLDVVSVDYLLSAVESCNNHPEQGGGGT